MAEGIIDLTSGIYQFIADCEASWKGRKQAMGDAAQRLRAAAARLAARAAEVKARAGDRLGLRLEEAAATLRAMAAELGERAPEMDRLKQLRKRLGASYEEFRANIRRRRMALPAGVTLRQLKPTNINRNVFHVAMGLLGVLMYEFVLDQSGVLILCGVLLAIVTGMEITRRLSPAWNERFVNGIFSKISRPGEAHQVPAATWYLLALFVGAALFEQRAIQLGALILGVGDPVAALVGKRWGRRKLVGEKSVAGTLGFFVAAFAASVAFLVLAMPTMGAGPLLALAAGASAAGAVAELWTGRIDDNFTIPIVVAGVSALLLAVMLG